MSTISQFLGGGGPPIGSMALFPFSKRKLEINGTEWLRSGSYETDITKYPESVDLGMTSLVRFNTKMPYNKNESSFFHNSTTDPFDKRGYICGGDGFVLRSDPDDSLNWERITLPRNGVNYDIDSNNSIIVIVGQVGNIFISRDHGNTWEDKSTGLNSLNSVSILNDCIVIQGDNSTILVSKDEGLTFTSRTPLISILPANTKLGVNSYTGFGIKCVKDSSGAIILPATNYSNTKNTLVSTDYGLTWTNLTSSINGVVSRIQVDSLGDIYIFYSNEYRFVRISTTNTGGTISRTLTTITHPLSNSYIPSGFIELTPGILTVGLYYNNSIYFYNTADKGVTFTLSTTIPTCNVGGSLSYVTEFKKTFNNDIIISVTSNPYGPNSARTLISKLGTSVWETYTNGSLVLGTQLDSKSCSTRIIDSQKGVAFYGNTHLSIANHNLYRYTVISGGLLATAYNSFKKIIKNPSNNYLFALAYLGQIYRSIDEGYSWKVVKSGTGRSSSAGAIGTHASLDILPNGTLVFCYAAETCYSSDYGDTWNYVPIAGLSLQSIVNKLGELIVLGQNTVFKTTDGINWVTGTISGTSWIDLKEDSTGTLYALETTTSTKLKKSVDRGLTWTDTAITGLSDSINNFVILSDNTLILAGLSTTPSISYSKNGGATWSVVKITYNTDNSGIQSQLIRCSDDTLIISIGNVPTLLYISKDKGLNWTTSEINSSSSERALTYLSGDYIINLSNNISSPGITKISTDKGETFNSLYTNQSSQVLPGSVGLKALIVNSRGEIIVGGECTLGQSKFNPSIDIIKHVVGTPQTIVEMNSTLSTLYIDSDRRYYMRVK